MSCGSVLIGPCGIETKQEAVLPRLLLLVLIGPCGIETLVDLKTGRILIVLIGPCGIETSNNLYLQFMWSCINWTLRN